MYPRKLTALIENELKKTEGDTKPFSVDAKSGERSPVWDKKRNSKLPLQAKKLLILQPQKLRESS
jgi:hypothetical protein